MSAHDNEQDNSNINSSKSPNNQSSNALVHPNEVSKEELLSQQINPMIVYNHFNNIKPSNSNSQNNSQPINNINSLLHGKNIKRRRGFQVDCAKLNLEDTAIGITNINTHLNNKEKTTRQVYESFKNTLDKILDNPITLSIFFVAAFFTLIGMDIRRLCVTVDNDMIFNSMYLITMILLGFEMIITFIAKNDYRLSFLFWLDILAMLSMALEVEDSIQDIIDLCLSHTIGDVVNKELKRLSNQLGIYMIVLKMLQIFRLTLLVRVYRALLSLIRQSELKYRLNEMKKKIAQKEEKERRRNREKKMNGLILPKKGKRKKSVIAATAARNSISISTNQFMGHRNSIIIANSLSNGTVNLTSNDNNLNLNLQVSNLEDQENALIQFTKNKKFEEKKKLEIENESQISKIVAKSITQKIIVMILLLLLVLPIYDEDNYLKNSPQNFGFLCKMINDELRDYNVIRKEFNETLQKMIQKNHAWLTNIISINTSLISIYWNSTLMNLSYRHNEIGYQFNEDGVTFIAYSMKRYFAYNAYVNIGRTFFVCIVLLLMAFIILRDTKKNILNPLEVMIGTVNAVAKDPVNYQSLEKLNKGMHDYVKTQQNKKKKHINEAALYVDYEIKTIQFAIIRISSLMAIGFGEAGGQILKENINSMDSLNPMLPGKKIQGVFGFCLIRNFAEINEALQERTILFVNSIADIVHSNVTKFGGACNKNIGESFLLIWKFPLNDDDKARMSQVATCAVLSFLNIIKKIYKSNTILSYRNDPLLKEKFKGKFSVKMGFGLHLGWGIEGAIGSFYKIDCSYLSPNVNIAARLETATNIYGVDLLISGELYSLLSSSMQKRCREIDRVTLKGSIKPVSLFTIDCNKTIPKGKINKKQRSGKEKRLYINNKKAQLFSAYELSLQEETITIDEVYLKKSKGLKNLLNNPKSSLFLDHFQKGFNEYITGNWVDAYQFLKEALFIDNRDGPTNCLIKFIEHYNKFPPSEWKGYRVLSAKF